VGAARSIPKSFLTRKRKCAFTLLTKASSFREKKILKRPHLTEKESKSVGRCARERTGTVAAHWDPKSIIREEPQNLTKTERGIAEIFFGGEKEVSCIPKLTLKKGPDVQGKRTAATKAIGEGKGRCLRQRVRLEKGTLVLGKGDFSREPAKKKKEKRRGENWVASCVTRMGGPREKKCSS